MAAALEAVRSWPDTVPDQNYTLGWEFAAFTAAYLVQPDGPDAGDPFVLTREQLRIALRWYEIDRRGRWVHRRGVLRRMKGWGKDPFGAALIWFEALGKCRFDHWDAEDRPVAKQHPSPWIQVSGVAKEQSKNTMTLLGPMLTEDAAERFGVDLGKEIIYVRHGRGRIEAISSSPRAIEGNRPTFVLKNETQHWIEANQGRDLSDTIRRNLGKSRNGDARSLAIQNAHVPGEASVAELDYEAHEAVRSGRVPPHGLYYDATEAPPGIDLADVESLKAGLLAARGDSVWLDVETLAAESLDYPAEKTRRFYLNQVVAADDAILSPEEWDEIVAPGEALQPGDEIVLGFDGSKTEDATALVAIRVEDRLIQPLGIWQAPVGPDGRDWEVPREEVDGAFRWAMSTFRVSAAFCDVAFWESYVDQWGLDYKADLLIPASTKGAVSLDMRGNQKEVTLGNERLIAAVVDGKVKRTARPEETKGGRLDRHLRSHVLNTRRRLNRHGVSFGKEHRGSDRKVDGYAATVLADMARMKVLESGKRRGSRKVRIRL